MSIHSSLKMQSGLTTVRSVLNRTERLAKLQATKGFDPSKKAILGLPKTLAKTK